MAERGFPLSCKEVLLDVFHPSRKFLINTRSFPCWPIPKWLENAGKNSIKQQSCPSQHLLCPGTPLLLLSVRPQDPPDTWCREGVGREQDKDTVFRPVPRVGHPAL